MVLVSCKKLCKRKLPKKEKINCFFSQNVISFLKNELGGAL